MSDEVYSIDDLPPPEEEVIEKPKVPRWVPKVWKPIYQEIVMYHIMGYTNKEIAEATGFNHFHVGIILNSPQAEGAKDKAFERLQTLKLGQQKARIERLADKALDRIEEVLCNDDLAETNPFPMMDRAIKFAQSARTLQPSDGSITENTNNTMNIAGSVTAIAVPKELIEGLLAGTKKANEVAQRLLPVSKDAG
jgi:hypothetical protein